MCCPPTVESVNSTNWSRNMFLTSLSVRKVEKKKTRWTHTKQKQRPRTNTLKTRYLSRTATAPAPCREHSVSGKGVIFSHSGLLSLEPTNLTVSLLIGLLLGSLLQDSVIRIITHITDYPVLCCLTRWSRLCTMYVSIMYSYWASGSGALWLWTTRRECEKGLSPNLTNIIGLLQKHLSAGNNHSIKLHDETF